METFRKVFGSSCSDRQLERRRMFVRLESGRSGQGTFFADWQTGFRSRPRNGSDGCSAVGRGPEFRKPNQELIMYRALSVVAVLVAVLLETAPAIFGQDQQPDRGIVNITGQLYRAQNNNHYTVFLVTPEGIIMSDPINRDFARWLKAEFATRFNVPVRYLLYTHHHWDHASGGVVFADTAEFVGHQNMLVALAPPAGNPPLSGEALNIDGNGNGLVERSEATGVTSTRFELFDYNRDNVLSGAELARGPISDVYPPTITYSDRHTITLAGKTVTMTHLGDAHADDSAVLHFPDERAVFGADILQVRRLPNNIAPTVGSYIDALRTINALEFEDALTGHALAGTKQDAADMLQYLEDLSAGVAAGIGAGRSLAETRRDAVRLAELDPHRVLLGHRVPPHRQHGLQGRQDRSIQAHRLPRAGGHGRTL